MLRGGTAGFNSDATLVLGGEKGRGSGWSGSMVEDLVGKAKDLSFRHQRRVSGRSEIDITKEPDWYAASNPLSVLHTPIANEKNSSALAYSIFMNEMIDNSIKRQRQLEQRLEDSSATINRQPATKGIKAQL